MVNTILDIKNNDKEFTLLKMGKLLIESYEDYSGFNCHMRGPSTWTMTQKMILKDIDSGRRYLCHIHYNGAMTIEKSCQEIHKLEDLPSIECTICGTKLSIPDAEVSNNYQINCKDSKKCYANKVKSNVKKEFEKLNLEDRFNLKSELDVGN